MNLHEIVRGAISAVNPEVSVTVKAATGAMTTLPNGQRVPGYTTITDVACQMQPLSTSELQHLDSLNVQGTLRGFWFSGTLSALNRPLQKGGDLITLGDGSVWLVVHVAEDWSPTAGWCHIVGQLQNAS